MVAYSTDSRSAAVRSRLDHPVIDADGHWLEPVPIFLDYLREVAGPSVAARFVRMATAHIDRGWTRRPPGPSTAAVTTASGRSSAPTSATST
jgi:hypothetical protein